MILIKFGCDFSPKIPSSFCKSLMYIFYFSICDFYMILIANSFPVAKWVQILTLPKAPFPMTLPKMYVSSTFCLNLNFLKSYICKVLLADPNYFFLRKLAPVSLWLSSLYKSSLMLNMGTDSNVVITHYFVILDLALPVSLLLLSLRKPTRNSYS